MHDVKVCPNPDQILALHRGELEGGPLDSVCQHLLSCSACESRLIAIENNDEVISNLRQYLGSEPLVGGGPSGYRVGPAPQSHPSGGSQGDSRSHRKGGVPGSLPERANLPRMLGTYELRQEIGKGGMGVVYSAVHTLLQKPFAVKVIRPEYADHPRVIARFRKESRATGSLSHLNIVAATDAGEVNGSPYLVMELVEGRSLASLLPLSIPDACEVIRQSADGLQYVHEKGMVHRDLKPSNLMLAVDGIVKLLDLGLAGDQQTQQSTESRSGDHCWMGTPDYMAPEQWADSQKVDIRADIYSLGCTLYQLLSGRAPFSGPECKSTARKQIAHEEAPPPSVRQLRPEVPMELDAILMRMMAKDPNDRFATPRHVALALQRFTSGADIRALSQEPLQLTVPWDCRVDAAVETAPLPDHNTPVKTGTLTIPIVARGSRKWQLAALAAILIMLGGVGGWAISEGGGGTNSRADAGGGIVAPGQVEPALQPGIWHDCLQREPTKILWNDIFKTKLFYFNRDKRELWASSSSPALIGFGRTEYSGYQLLFGIHQDGWVGGVGVFFGLHDAIVHGQPCRKCQVLELKARKELNPKDGFIITRSWLYITGENGAANINSIEVKSATLEPPIRGHQYLLSVEVKNGRLSEVRWNGKPFPEIVGANLEEQEALKDEDYVGEFGGFNRRSTSLFSKVQVMPYERRP